MFRCWLTLHFRILFFTKKVPTDSVPDIHQRRDEREAREREEEVQKQRDEEVRREKVRREEATHSPEEGVAEKHAMTRQK